MNKKKLVSLGIAAIFLALGTTGLLLYLVQHNKPTKVIHTTFGLFFVAVAMFHIINNWGSLVSYVKDKGIFRLNKETLLVLVLAAGSVVGAGLMLPPFEFIEEFGERLRNGERPKTTKISFNRIDTNQELHGTAVTIQLEKRGQVLIPVIGIWAEDSAGHVISDLFIPAKMLKVFEGEEGNEEHAIREGEVEPVEITKEALPTWFGKKPGGAPNHADPTPKEDLILESKVKTEGAFAVFVEISSLGKTELYKAELSASGSYSKLNIVNGEGKMLRGFAVRQ